MKSNRKLAQRGKGCYNHTVAREQTQSVGSDDVNSIPGDIFQLLLRGSIALMRGHFALVVFFDTAAVSTDKVAPPRRFEA